MGIGQQVESDLKAAIKARDELRVSCLRMIRATLKNKEKDLLRALQEEEEIKCLTTMAKQRRESISQFEKGGRMDLAQKEAAELEIISAYLPRQMDETEVASVIEKVFADLQPSGPRDMGRVMKEVMTRLQGKADGKLVNSLVSRKLQG